MSPTVGNRLFQWLLIGSTLAFSWLGMMVVHEFGHVLQVWFDGRAVERVILPPLGISRTIPCDTLSVVWGGPVWGCIIPLLMFGAALLVRWRYWHLLRFFAGFCLIANGCYLAFGSFNQAGDAGDLMHMGTPQWVLILFGLPTIGLGLWFWHRLGPQFGLGPTAGPVDRRAAIGVGVALVLLVLLELWLGSKEPS
jgi:hypothetical protein